jgi:hypothetical protein
VQEVAVGILQRKLPLPSMEPETPIQPDEPQSKLRPVAILKQPPCTES